MNHLTRWKHLAAAAALLLGLLNAPLTAAPGPEVVPHLRAEGLLYFVSAGSSIVVRAGPKREVVASQQRGRWRRTLRPLCRSVQWKDL